MVILTTLYFLCGIIYVIIGIFTFSNDSKNKLNKIFFAMCISLSYWALMFALKNSSVDAEAASTFHIYSTLSWSIFHCLFLHFVIVLTSRDSFFKKPYKYLFFYSPAIFSIYLYFFEPPTARNFVKTSLGYLKK